MLRAAAVCVLLAGPAAAGVPLVELATPDGPFRGRVLAKTADVALLLDRDGGLHEVPLAEVTAYSVAAATFRPYSSVDLRDRLLRLVGGEADAVATPHFVVVGRAASARAVGEVLEDLFDGYRWYCSTRGLPFASPEFPLVAVVFPDRATFDAYCRADGMPPAAALQGYYRPETNRFVCYESRPAAGGLGGDLRDTIVHEALHQVAFNTGLHARGADLPTWVAEGFATALEPEAARRPLRSDSRPLDRANPERLERFLRSAGDGLRPEQVVASEAAFAAAPLDAYAYSWAMTFYFMEAKPTAYARYLRTLAARPPLADYPPADRLTDFRAAFGGDEAMLAAEILRFHRRVAAGERR